MKAIIYLFFLIPGLTHAIPEDQFEDLWKKKALPYFQQIERGEIVNLEGLKIRYYSVQKNAPETLVIVPGRTEPALKYAELLYDLRHANLNVFIFSHQGQGESERLLNDPHKGHVRNFHNYVKDMELFMEKVVSKTPGKKFLLAHSMGGAVAALYLANNPDVFEKAVLSAPMMELNTDPYPETVARYLGRLLVSIGKGTSYAPDRGPYIPEADVFETNPATLSEVRFNASKHIFTHYPEVAIGGPTARWVHEALKATKNIHKLQIKTPVLMFQSGLDEFVKPGSQNQFCRKSFCEKIEMPESKHEILMERDFIRNEALAEIESFFGLKLFPKNW
jgi:lysophospholipase